MALQGILNGGAKPIDATTVRLNHDDDQAMLNLGMATPPIGSIPGLNQMNLGGLGAGQGDRLNVSA